MTVSKGGKPAVVLCEDYAMWLMNPTDAAMQVNAGEICGFGTGSFDEAIIGISLALNR